LVSCNPLDLIALTTQPGETSETLFEGIQYTRVVQNDPRPMVIHIIEIDLKAKGIEPLVTPPDESGSDQPLEARTTSTFLSQFGVQLAINGDAYYVERVDNPLFSDGLLVYPLPGEPVNPTGYAASRGIAYSQDTNNEHTLYISPSNKASLDQPLGKLHMAISGSKLLVQNNKAVVHEDDTGPEPRTAIGTNRAGNKLLIIVVDGRQPGYSEGATLLELSGLMMTYSMYDAINLDGGGSSTLVIQGADGSPRVLNSPIHQSIPGNERPVANHLGFFALP
jgi:hypothetical protein